MGSSELLDELKELEAYRDKVLQHLRERELKMQELEKEVAQVAFMLKEYGVQKLARTGDARSLIRGEKFRGELSRERQRLDRRLEEARNDVGLARERLAAAETELAEMKASVEEQV